MQTMKYELNNQLAQNIDYSTTFDKTININK